MNYINTRHNGTEACALGPVSLDQVAGYMRQVRVTVDTFGGEACDLFTTETNELGSPMFNHLFPEVAIAAGRLQVETDEAVLGIVASPQPAPHAMTDEYVIERMERAGFTSSNNVTNGTFIYGSVEACRALLAQPAAVEPAAFLFNATEAMINAALKIDWSNDGDVRGVAHNVWNAMCAAMPDCKAIDAQGAEPFAWAAKVSLRGEVVNEILTREPIPQKQIDDAQSVGCVYTVESLYKHPPASPPPAATLGKAEFIRFDFINADGNEDSKVITHDEMRERYANAHKMAYQTFAQPPAASDVRDAARYQWMRLTFIDDEMAWPDDVADARTGDQLDTAIDRALQSTPAVQAKGSR